MTKKAAPTKKAPFAKKAVAKAAGKKATKPAKIAAVTTSKPKHHTVFLLEDDALDDMLAFSSKEAARRFMASKPDIFDDPDEDLLKQEIVREKDGVILAAPPAKVYVFCSDDDGVICVFRNAKEARDELLHSVMDPGYDQRFEMLELVVRKKVSTTAYCAVGTLV